MSTFLIKLRPHPKKITEVIDYLRFVECPCNVLVDSSDSLAIFMREASPQLVFARESGSAVELALEGWPIFLMNSEFSRLLNPLVFAGQNLYVIDGLPESLAQVTKFIESDSVEEYSCEIRRSAKYLISHIGVEADHNLVSHLFKDSV